MLRDTLDRYGALHIGELYRLNLSTEKLNLVGLKRGQSNSGSIVVEMTENGNLILEFTVQGWREELLNPIRQEISISRTPSGSGERRWFLCPLCCRRTAILYSYPYFMCRICVGLPYASQSQSASKRRLNRALRQRLKMGGTASIADPFPPRPKGMWKAAYARKKEEDERVIKSYLSPKMDLIFRMTDSASKRNGTGQRSSSKPH
jgi:hypothetical protein